LCHKRSLCDTNISIAPPGLTITTGALEIMSLVGVPKLTHWRVPFGCRFQWAIYRALLPTTSPFSAGIIHQIVSAAVAPAVPGIANSEAAAAVIAIAITVIVDFNRWSAWRTCVTVLPIR
jgi:hypothetical protein